MHLRIDACINDFMTSNSSNFPLHLPEIDDSYTVSLKFISEILDALFLNFLYILLVSKEFLHLIFLIYIFDIFILLLLI